MDFSPSQLVHEFVRNDLERLYADTLTDEHRLRLTGKVLRYIGQDYYVNTGRPYNRRLDFLDVRNDADTEKGIQIRAYKEFENDLIGIFDIRQIPYAGKRMNSGLYDAMYRTSEESEPKRFENGTGGIETIVRAFQRFLRDVVLTVKDMEEQHAARLAKREQTVEPAP